MPLLPTFLVRGRSGSRRWLKVICHRELQEPNNLPGLRMHANWQFLAPDMVG
jgi:hypothetical protein